MTKKTRVNLTNLQNSQPGLWDCDTTYKANKNNNYEAQFSINPMLKEEIKKKLKKRQKKKPESTWLTCKTCNLSHKIRIINRNKIKINYKV